MPRTAPGRSLVAVVVGAGLLAACGGGSGQVSSKRHATTTTSTTVATTTTTTPASTTTTTAPAPGTGCTTAQLSPSFGMVSAGAGNRYLRLILTNTGGASCTIGGYVGLQLVGAANQVVPTNVLHSMMFPLTQFSVPPGSQASSLLHWGAVASGAEPQNGPCEATAQQVQVSVPGQATPLVVAWTFGPVCQQGQIDVGALQVGVPAQ